MLEKNLAKDKNVEKIIKDSDSLLLMGAPNVGKSVFFSKMTKIHVTSSNYSGTTVSYMQGDYIIDERKMNLIDVPGTYSLSATNDAERIAIEFLSLKPNGVLFILNASDLEGSVKLLLEVLKTDIPVVAALNLKDVAKRQGKIIDVDKLSQEMGVPIVPTVAVTGKGFEELRQAIRDNIIEPKPNKVKVDESLTNRDLWKKSREICKQVVSFTNEKESKLDRFGNALLRPWPGILISILIILLSLAIVVFAGKALRAVLLLPLVNKIIVPFFEKFFAYLNLPPMLNDIFIGDYGMFRISFEWILTLILPYVTLFQFVFTFLEDSGVLPRMAVLFDNVMSKLGIQGGSLINIMLAFGCAVPAIISTRTSHTRKERLIVTTLICFSVPCMSQTGALISLFSGRGFVLPLAMFITVLILIVIIAKITNLLIKGKVVPMILEIPNILVPNKEAFFKKFAVRFKQFLIEAEGPMLVAVMVASVLVGTRVLDPISSFFEPVISGWLGLPKETTLALILGVIRREMSVAPLTDPALGLNNLQIFVGGVVSLLYIPCLSVFGIVASEFNAKVSILIAIGTTTSAIFVGGLINHIAQLFL